LRIKSFFAFVEQRRGEAAQVSRVGDFFNAIKGKKIFLRENHKMRKAKAMDVVLGLFALALIYVIVSTNSSITGFVIGPPTTIELTTPADNTETTQNSITFIFKYPPEVEIKECSLVMDSNVVKKLTDFLSPYGT
jgi:hypothetical protein